MQPVVAPFLISQCYNSKILATREEMVVAPFLISQCYNTGPIGWLIALVVAPFLISQCYNTPTGNPYSIRVSRFIWSEKMGLE